MINLKSLFGRSQLAAFGALALGLTLGAAPAHAAPLYPYGYSAPQVQQAPQVEEDTDAFELPARFKRQVVSYSGPEAPGTIIVDTPNTYLYFVLGGGRAIRYGIGVGREGFTWSGVQQISKKSEWPDWHPPADMLARQPYLPRFMAGGPGNPLGAARHVSRRHHLPHSRHQQSVHHRRARLLRLHPHDQRGRHRPLLPRQYRHQGHRQGRWTAARKRIVDRRLVPRLEPVANENDKRIDPDGALPNRGAPFLLTALLTQTHTQ